MSASIGSAQRFPHVDIHSLSTSEICGIAKRENMAVADVLTTLRAAGLKSLPGAGAEILVERVRKRISARKIDDDRWIEVMRIAQGLGMPTTTTMMFGSVETDAERIARLEEEVAELRRDVSEVKDQLERFRKQFE